MNICFLKMKNKKIRWYTQLPELSLYKTRQSAHTSMVLAPDFERQNISLVTEQRLRSALTSFGLWPRSRCSVTREILKPFEN
jgi:hypothetical protein